MNFILIIAPAGSINNETVFVICGGCCFYHKSETLKNNNNNNLHLYSANLYMNIFGCA